MLMNMVKDGIMNLVMDKEGIYIKAFGTVYHADFGPVIIGAIAAVVAIVGFAYLAGKKRALKELAEYEPDESL